MSEYNKSWLNSSSYYPKIIKRHQKLPESLPSKTTKENKASKNDRIISPVINEHVFQKSLPLLQRFVEPTSPFIELDENRMLMVTLSTLILMARDQKIPQNNRLWTESYLKCIRDRNGKVPLNIEILLKKLQHD